MGTFDPKKIGERIRSIRGKLSRSDIENRWGVSPTSLQRYEKGQRNPDTEFLAALASDGIDVHWLVTGETYQQPVGAIPTAPAAQAPFDHQRLRDVAFILEEVLIERGLALTPTKKAELIVLLYEEATEWEATGKPYDKDKVVRLVHLAS